eukprot:gene24351-45079_t
MNACRKRLSDGRWHFQHGPMDLILQAEGAHDAVALAHERAWQRFEGLLQELVNELPGLRAPVGEHCAVQGVVARRMWAACSPYRAGFITSMAAVAGAVAQEILACYDQQGVGRAWVNNGGDIALHLAPGQSVTVGVYADIAALNAAQLHHGLVLDGQIRIDSAMPVRGVATSGWRGRSQSLGIADSVTVLAPSAPWPWTPWCSSSLNRRAARGVRRAGCPLTHLRHHPGRVVQRQVVARKAISAVNTFDPLDTPAVLAVQRNVKVVIAFPADVPPMLREECGG